MPAGDPAGYLPSVIKKRLKKAGATPYKARARRPKKKLTPGVKPRPKAGPTGGVEAPSGSKVTPLPRVKGGKGKLPPHLRGRRPFKGARRSGF